MSNPLAERLRRFVELTEEECTLLDELTDPARHFRPNDNLLREEDPSSDTHIIVDGFAIEYRMLFDGERQIVRLLFAGDVFNQNASVLHKQQSDFAAQTDCRVMTIREQSLDRLLKSSRLAKAWIGASQLDHEALVENVVRIGRRSSVARTAHFLAETHHRMLTSGLADCDLFTFPMNQQQLADLLGMSTVHMNRSLRSLVDLGAVRYRQKQVTVVSRDKLHRAADFNPDYLCIRGESPFKSAPDIAPLTIRPRTMTRDSDLERLADYV